MTPMHVVTLRRWQIGLAFLILTVTFTVGLIWLQQLAGENRARIAEIQQSRVYSCIRTYQSFHDVFDPFLPPKGHRSAQQRKDLARFDRIIEEKKASCARQTKPR